MNDNQLLPVDLSEQIAEVELELKYRARTYARMVSNGMMTQAKMDRKIEVMAAVKGSLIALREYLGDGPKAA